MGIPRIKNGTGHFDVFAPDADLVEILLFHKCDENEPFAAAPMVGDHASGIWYCEIPKHVQNAYYLYRVTRGGETKYAVDPYARAVGVNGTRGMIIDLRKTDPPGFHHDRRPPFSHPCDAVIYELHIRDLSMHPHSGITHRGKFLGLAEKSAAHHGVRTGLAHILDLGVTHIHLLPCFDFQSVDEEGGGDQYNWGYDPQNYNTPEGSYATDARDGRVRIREFKTLVMALHKAGLRVIMDVVYNHVYDAAKSNFEILSPGICFRYVNDADSTCPVYSNGSGCGNETASEHPWMCRFIVDSVCYWASEYHIDGFRFDLMGLHDIRTMNIIRQELDKIDPSILMYGEGWTAEPSPLNEELRAVKKNTMLLDERIAVFSDDMRDGIKGSVLEESARGFVNACDKDEYGRCDEKVKFGILAATGGGQHWAAQPSQCVNYASCHDDHCLWDKLVLTIPTGEDTLVKMNKLAAALVLTSQGIPFIMAGEEMARTKGGVKNSYNSPDSVNRLDWDRKARFTNLYEYYRGLIALRKSSPAFRLRTAEDIGRRIRFINTEKGVIAYTIDADGVGTIPYSHYLLIFNSRFEDIQIENPGGGWEVLADAENAGTARLATITDNRITVPAKSALVLRTLQ